MYNGIDDESMHFANFKANVDKIVATNAKNLTFLIGVNEFADRTPDEIAAMYTGLKPVSLWSGLPRLGTFEYDGADLPSSMDWTTQGVVTTEPVTVWFLLVLFHHGCSRVGMGTQHGEACVTERAAVCGLRRDRLGL